MIGLGRVLGLDSEGSLLATTQIKTGENTPREIYLCVKFEFTLKTRRVNLR